LTNQRLTRKIKVNGCITEVDSKVKLYLHIKQAGGIHMATYKELMNKLNSPQAKELFKKLYGTKTAESSEPAERYRRIMEEHVKRFDSQEKEMLLFSTSGRTEIGGNHTDHNGGRVLAAGVSLDTIAAVTANDTGIITVYSEGYPELFRIDLKDLDKKKEEEGTTFALIRGIAARMKELEYGIGGFDACITSNVLRGSGLSSSAAFEVLICTILDHLYNQGDMDVKLNAMISQYAENVYFGKPCGLMDQTACALGGFVTIDFKEPGKPIVRSVDFDFTSQGYSLVVVDTGGDHADLTDEYASIAQEMQQVAEVLGGKVLRDIQYEKMMKAIPHLRSKASDRAILRAMHFFHDDQRVVEEVEALDQGDFKRFLSLVIESGESSWRLLQNCYVGGSTHQGLALALAVSQEILEGKGAWRVHGGGFAGTIQAFVPNDLLEVYVDRLDRIFGSGACTILSIRSLGSIRVDIRQFQE
jgi:galactokinase